MRTETSLGLMIVMYNIATALIGFSQSRRKGAGKINDSIYSMLLGINPILAIVYGRIVGRRIKVWRLVSEDIFICNLWITGVTVLFISELRKNKVLRLSTSQY